MMHAILIWFDSLPFGLPGFCGNTEAATIGLDRLASKSIVFDNVFATSIGERPTSLLEEVICDLHREGIRMRFLAMSPTSLSKRLSALNASLPEIEIHSRPADLIECAQQLILHKSNPGSSSERQMTIILLPNLNRADDEGGETGLSIEIADHIIGSIAGNLAEVDRDDILVLLSASCGVAAQPATSLTDANAHVPTIGRLGIEPIFGTRCDALATTNDVAATIADWFDRPVPNHHALSLLPFLRDDDGQMRQESDPRSSIVIEGRNNDRGLRTKNWLLTVAESQIEVSLAQTVEAAQLYSKPDDFWDQLDISSQQPILVENLLKELRNHSF